MGTSAQAQGVFELASPNPQPDGLFGRSVAGIPDLDGDRRGDLLVSAIGEDGGAESAGRAYLFSGATGELLRTLNSPNARYAGAFGLSVAGVEDVDDDGRGDLLVGAPYEMVENELGRAYLFSGATGALLHAFASPNAEYGRAFGWAVAGVEDVDRDGRGDLLVGAWARPCPA